MNDSEQPPLATDAEEGLAFCGFLAAAGPWLLTTIDPTKGESDAGKLVSRSWEPKTAAAMKTWIVEMNQVRRCNVYVQVNHPARVGKSGRPKKPDYLPNGKQAGGRFRAWCVDRDVIAGVTKAQVIAAVEAAEAPPSAVLDSGGGAQGFWLPRESFEVTSQNVIDAVEATNRGLSAELGGDHTHDIGRLMRLPGTINWPNMKKLADGRVPVMSRTIALHPERRYDTADLPSKAPGAGDSAAAGESAAGGGAGWGARRATTRRARSSERGRASAPSSPLSSASPSASSPSSRNWRRCRSSPTRRGAGRRRRRSAPRSAASASPRSTKPSSWSAGGCGRRGPSSRARWCWSRGRRSRSRASS
jgi:hypothetical protein